MTVAILQGAQAKCLALEAISGLAEELSLWRLDHEVELLAKTRAKERVFDFVKGLRFSARLIYIIREHLSRYALEVDWGQVIKDDGTDLSPECDVIIHKPGHHRHWNGDKKVGQVMSFKFVQLSDVVAVISCKSKLSTITEKMKDYCQRLTPYLGGTKLWLFAECIPKGKASRIAQDAMAAGYQKCWYLYSWDRKNSMVQKDKQLLLTFIEQVIKLGESTFKMN